jgi:tetratricopeptide (TPR) repeat protein
MAVYKCLPILFLISFLALNALPSFGIDEESLAQQAEQAGKYREALTHYVNALQSVSEGSAKDSELREKIINLSQKIQPPPAVPEETVKYEGRAEAAVRNAKTPEDFLDASKEYRKALLLAPWVASYYFNLGVVLEKAGKPDEAIRSLRLYLLAATNAPDLREVQKRIAGLEYEDEKQAERKALGQQNKFKPESLSGIWSRWKDDKWFETVELRITGRLIETRRLRWNDQHPRNTNWEELVSDFDFDGKSLNSSAPLRYGNRTKSWKMTLISNDAMIEEYFYEGGEGAKRYQDGELVSYVTSPAWNRVEWKRER